MRCYSACDVWADGKKKYDAEGCGRVSRQFVFERDLSYISVIFCWASKNKGTCLMCLSGFIKGNWLLKCAPG